jgi:uncharacterized membrane protein YfcA
MSILISVFIPILAGLLVGILIAMTGMGGGAIMTPFLILVMKVNPVLAIGTDLVFAALTKWTSGLQHRRQKNVSLRMVAWLALGSLPASFLASSFVLSHHANPGDLLERLLPKILGAVLIVVSLYTLARIFNWIKVNEDLNWPPNWALALIGALGGGLVGLTSVGSGTVIMASLLIFFSLPPTQLVGLDVMHGALLATVPAGVYAFGGQVDWPLVGLLLLGSVPGAWLGTRLITRVPQRLVRGALSGFLLFAGVRLFL